MPTTLSAQPDDQPEFFSTGPSGFLRVNRQDERTPAPKAENSTTGDLNRFNGHPDASATDEDVARMVEVLARFGRTSARVVSLNLGYDHGDGESGKRKVRAIANRSGGQIIGLDDGYILKSMATPEELREAAGRIRSQIAKMTARLAEIEAVRP